MSIKANLSDYLKDRLLRIRNKIHLIDDAHLPMDQKTALFKACDTADYRTVCDMLEIADGNSDICKTENQRISSIQLLVMQSLLNDFKNECIGVAYRNILEATALLVNDPIPYPSIELLRISGRLETKDTKEAAKMLAPFFEDFVKDSETCITNLGNKSAIERYLRTAMLYLDFLEPVKTGG